MFSLVAPPGGSTEDQISATDGRTRSSNHDCAICLGEATLALETNCGHVYCGNCILEVWRRSNALQATLCPYCRQRVTIMLPYFSQGLPVGGIPHLQQALFWGTQNSDGDDQR